MTALPRPVRLLGYAGILPQVLCIAMLWTRPAGATFGLIAGVFYAALILSFLGGMWWMAALRAGETSWRVYGIAVLPSLYAWAAMLPPVLSGRLPVLSALLLGAGLLASPLLDLSLHARMPWPDGWLRLRTTLATGLGVATIVLGKLFSV